MDSDGCTAAPVQVGRSAGVGAWPPPVRTAARAPALTGTPHRQYCNPELFIFEFNHARRTPRTAAPPAPAAWPPTGSPAPNLHTHRVEFNVNSIRYACRTCMTGSMRWCMIHCSDTAARCARWSNTTVQKCDIGSRCVASGANTKRALFGEQHMPPCKHELNTKHQPVHAFCVWMDTRSLAVLWTGRSTCGCSRGATWLGP